MSIKLFGKTIVSSSDPKDNINQEDDHALIEESRSGSSASTAETSTTIKSKSAPAPQQNLSCPRCKSKETKFCYYNNYNVNQPRHFCKACHRYWTAGGLLRNVPVEAGRRKNRALLPPPPPSTQEPGHENEEGCGSVLVGRAWRGGSSARDPAKSTFGNVDSYLISYLM